MIVLISLDLQTHHVEWRTFKYGEAPSTKHTRRLCHLDWWWKVCDLNAQISGKNLKKWAFRLKCQVDYEVWLIPSLGINLLGPNFLLICRRPKVLFIACPTQSVFSPLVVNFHIVAKGTEYWAWCLSHTYCHICQNDNASIDFILLTLTSALWTMSIRLQNFNSASTLLLSPF